MIDDEPKQSAHISYRDYKKLVNRNPKQSLILFVSVFFTLLLVFLGFAKLMSPDVDISLGDEEVALEEDSGIRGGVDHRLKEIQMEDNYDAIGGEDLAVEDDGKVVIPKTKDTKPEEAVAPQEEEPINLEHKSAAPAPQADVSHEETKQTTAAPAPQAAPTPAINARVVVGFYTTAEQAEVARSILQDAGLGMAPFIRKMGSGYTLQVGSYNSKEKAMNIANELLIKNYPARVIIEQK